MTLRRLGGYALGLLMVLGGLAAAYVLLLVVLVGIVRVAGDPADWAADSGPPCTLVMSSGAPECREDLGGPGFVIDWPWSARP